MSDFVIVGSFGLEVLDIRLREPADLDVWYYGNIPNITPSNIRIEYKEMPEKIVKYVQENYNLNTFYTIKLSHAAWDIKWEKTVSDMAELKKRGATCNDVLYDMLFSYWEQIHGDKTFLSLKKTKEQFFTNNVRCHIDHDYLHEVVAHYDVPLYTTVLKQGEDVLIDKSKFMALSSYEDSYGCEY